MKAKDFISNKRIGNNAEGLIDAMALKSKLQWESESVVDSAKRRKKGGIDRKYISPVKFNLEIKSVSQYQISHNFCGNDQGKDIKTDQIAILNKAYRHDGIDGGFAIQFRPCDYFIFVHINDFMNHIMTAKWKHLKHVDALKIGLVFKDMDWVKDYTYEPKECLQTLIDAEKTPIEQLIAEPKEEKPINNVQIGMKLDINW